MHRVDAPGATPENEFTDGDPQSGIPATTLESKYMNTVQRELINVVESAGLTLDEQNDGQLKEAINEMIGPPVVLPPIPSMEILRYGPGVSRSITANTRAQTICTLNIANVKAGDIIDVQCRPNMRSFRSSGFVVVSILNAGSATVRSYDTGRSDGVMSWSLYSNASGASNPNPMTKLLVTKSGSLVLNQQAYSRGRHRVFFASNKLFAMLTRYTGAEVTIK